MHEGPYSDPLSFTPAEPTVRVFCPREGCDHDEEMTESEARVVVEYCCPNCLRTGLTFIAKARAA